MIRTHVQCSLSGKYLKNMSVLKHLSLFFLPDAKWKRCNNFLKLTPRCQVWLKMLNEFWGMVKLSSRFLISCFPFLPPSLLWLVIKWVTIIILLPFFFSASLVSFSLLTLKLTWAILPLAVCWRRSALNLGLNRSSAVNKAVLFLLYPWKVRQAYLFSLSEMRKFTNSSILSFPFCTEFPI